MRKKWNKIIVCAGVVLLLCGCGKAQESYEKGMELATAGNYEKSLPYFEEAIQESKDKAEYYIGYGMALNHLGRYEEAGKELKKVLQDKNNKISKENNKQVYYGLSISEYNLGEYDNVIEYCGKALEIEYLDDMDCDILYTRMMAYCQQEAWENARKDCQEIIEENKKYYDAYFALAEIERRIGNNDEAVKAYLAVIDEDDMNYDAYFALYDQYLYSGQEDAANELLGQIISLKANKAENMLAIGRAYLCKKDYESAEEYLNMAYTGNCKESQYYLGLLYAEKKAYEDALQSFQTYIKENKKDFNIEAYYQMALIYMEQDKYDMAQNVLTKGIACGSSNVMQALKKTQVILKEKQNQYKEALSLAKEYQKLYPADEGIEKEIAFIKTRLKK